MAPRIIGIVGPQGSGKTEVAKILLDHGAVVVRMGDAVWEETKRRGLEINEENIGRVAADLRREMGPAAVAKICIPLINEKGLGAKLVIVDGIRSIDEVEEFRREFGLNFRLLAVTADRRLRISRIMNRGRDDDARSEAEFDEKDRREAGWGLPEAIERADFLIQNDGTIDQLREKIEGIRNRLVGRGMRITVRAEVKPTEDPIKVKRALERIFPEIKFIYSDGLLVGESGNSESISTLRRLLRQQAILDTARSVMISNMKDDVTRFMLNKQAAFVGKVSFTEGESPLGPIEVLLRAEDPQRLIDHLAPRTENGRPVCETEY